MEHQQEIYIAKLKNNFDIPEKKIKDAVNNSTDIFGEIPEGMQCLICLQMVYEPILCQCGGAFICKTCKP